MHCQQAKVECKHPTGLFPAIMIPEWKWDVISMYFIIGFPRALKQHYYIMVLVDRLSKVAHFIVVESTNSASEVAQIFIKDIVRLHGVPKKIISDRDVKSISKFWKDLFVGLGTKLRFNTTYNLQKDGHIERVNMILEDMLRMYFMHQQRKWAKYLQLIDFAYNNGY